MDSIYLKGTREEVIIELLKDYPEFYNIILDSQERKENFLEEFLSIAATYGASIKLDDEGYTENINREKFNIPKTRYFVNINKTLFDIFQDAAIITTILAVLGIGIIDVNKLAMLPIVVFARMVKHSTRASDLEKCAYDAIVILRKDLGKDKISKEDLSIFYDKARMDCKKKECRFNRIEKCNIGSDVVEKLLEELEKKEMIKKNSFDEWDRAF